MDANRTSSISNAATDKQIGDFWDTHDFTEFDSVDAPDVELKITCSVSVEADLFSALEQQAHQRGIQVETLVNLWLQQKLAEAS